MSCAVDQVSVLAWDCRGCFAAHRRQASSYTDRAGFTVFVTPKTKKAHHSVSLLSTAYGAGTRNRTRDLLITSQLLYHLSYTGNGASL